MKVWSGLYLEVFWVTFGSEDGLRNKGPNELATLSLQKSRRPINQLFGIDHAIGKGD
jgi:hypothetical protein